MLAQEHAAEFDSGPTRPGPGTERLCIVTRKVKPIDELIRFVVAPDGSVVADLKQRLPGRGVWVSGTRRELTEAIRRSAFAKGFKKEVKVSADLVEITERLLERAALDALAIAGKAKDVVSGFAKVEAALERDRVKGLMHATDARPDGIKKINAALHRRSGANTAEIPVVTAFTSAQLDLALGRSNVVHAALLAGSACATFLARCLRLERFRTGKPGARGLQDPNQA
jgi:predicted RNA-binding protein YlxR (DUF448 family)